MLEAVCKYFTQCCTCSHVSKHNNVVWQFWVRSVEKHCRVTRAEQPIWYVYKSAKTPNIVFKCRQEHFTQTGAEIMVWFWIGCMFGNYLAHIILFVASLTHMSLFWVWVWLFDIFSCVRVLIPFYKPQNDCPKMIILTHLLFKNPYDFFFLVWHIKGRF